MNPTHPPKGIFITGTSTDVGKTFVTAALLRALAVQGIEALPVKAVQTGIASHPDAHAHADATVYTSVMTEHATPHTAHTLYQFSLPASPHLAAMNEGVHLTVHDIVHRICTLCEKYDNIPLLVEGAGGILVPLNEQEDVIDIATALRMPIVIVVRNILGALNHAQLTIEGAERRGLHVCAVIMNEGVQHTAQDAQRIATDNHDFLARRYPHIRFFSLPHLHDTATQWQSAAHTLSPLAWLCKELWQRPCNDHGDGKHDDDHDNDNDKHGGGNFVTQRDDNDYEGLTRELLTWDKEHLWHPYTSTTHPLPVYSVARAHGKYIMLHSGRHLLDGMSSWWCAIHGYSHPYIVAAAQKQSAHLSHVMFGGLTHEAAVAASKKLLHLMNPMTLAHAHAPLSRVFWADSGSVAVEVALKMALQYQHGRGHTQRTRILTPRGGYYGDTQGAMSVCDPVNGMHTFFMGTLPQQIFVEKPSCAFHQTCADEHLLSLEQAFTHHGQRLAACIVEPIVQGAGGMHFYHPDYLRRLRALCTQYDVLLICDEIATGFGRTGKMFASEWASIVADIYCVGKALTGGFMNLAATACTEDVAQTVCARGAVFMHGPTFMANPLACAVAAASMDVLTASPWHDNVARIEKALRHGLMPLAEHEDVHDVRVLGAIGVVETKRPIRVAEMQNFFVQDGVWIRPFGKLLYVMPPYIFTEDDVNTLTSSMTRAIQSRRYLF